MLKSKIPIMLIYARLFIGMAILALSFSKVDNYPVLAVVLLTIGLLTDIFDGIIARRLQVSTEKLRRLDSSIDQLFFLLVVGAAYLQCAAFFEQHLWMLAILLAVEALTYVVSFLKFGKEVATHSIGAKIWTLFIFATLIQVLLQCEANMLFHFCFWIGMVTRVEIIAIILVLKQWTNDVPTIYHALQLRRNKAIRRNKWFNG